MTSFLLLARSVGLLALVYGAEFLAQGQSGIRMLESATNAFAKLPQGTSNDGSYNFWREADGGDFYQIALSYKSGIVDVVQITPTVNYGSGTMPNFRIAARFAPYAVDFSVATWKGSYDQGETRVQWWIWETLGKRVMLTSATQLRDGGPWKAGQLKRMVWQIRPNEQGLPLGRDTATQSGPSTIRAGVWKSTTDGTLYTVFRFADGKWRGFKSGAEQRVGNESIRFSNDPNPFYRQGTGYAGEFVTHWYGRTYATSGNYVLNQGKLLFMEGAKVGVELVWYGPLSGQR